MRTGMHLHRGEVTADTSGDRRCIDPTTALECGERAGKRFFGAGMHPAAAQRAKCCVISAPAGEVDEPLGPPAGAPTVLVAAARPANVIRDANNGRIVNNGMGDFCLFFKFVCLQTIAGAVSWTKSTGKTTRAHSSRGQVP